MELRGQRRPQGETTPQADRIGGLGPIRQVRRVGCRGRPPICRRGIDEPDVRGVLVCPARPVEAGYGATGRLPRQAAAGRRRRQRAHQATDRHKEQGGPHALRLHLRGRAGQLESLLFQSDARSSVPVSFVVDDAFHVLNWHYSDKGDEKATAQCIQDWLDRYFTS